MDCSVASTLACDASTQACAADATNRWGHFEEVLPHSLVLAVPCRMATVQMCVACAVSLWGHLEEVPPLSLVPLVLAGEAFCECWHMLHVVLTMLSAPRGGPFIHFCPHAHHFERTSRRSVHTCPPAQTPAAACCCKRRLRPALDKGAVASVFIAGPWPSASAVITFISSR